MVRILDALDRRVGGNLHELPRELPLADFRFAINDLARTRRRAHVELVYSCHREMILPGSLAR